MPISPIKREAEPSRAAGSGIPASIIPAWASSVDSGGPRRYVWLEAIARPQYCRSKEPWAMTTFDKRKEGFEGKFARDEELRFKAAARRNKLLGLWAAEKLGLQGPDAE